MKKKLIHTERTTSVVEPAELANLRVELEKYKVLYADETQKRLAFAEQLRKYEGGNNADT